MTRSTIEVSAFSCPKCGVPLRSNHSMGLRARWRGCCNEEDRFLAKIDKNGPNGCWLFTGARLPKKIGGYGWAHWQGKRMGAHRIAYMLFKGEITEGLEVCHTCDNGPCCNPDHLFLGTHADNMGDCRAKGRYTHGEANKKSKLKEPQVREIIALKGSGIHHDELGRRYGVGGSAIWNIWIGHTWAHIPREASNAIRNG